MWCDMKLSTCYVGSGASQEGSQGQPLSVPAQGHQYELQSDLKMVTAYARLRGA